MTQKQGVIIVAAWLTFTFVAFALLSAQQLVAFDPDRSLDKIARQTFTQSLLTDIDLAQSGTYILHFSQKNCRCQQFSERHIQAINQAAPKKFVIKHQQLVQGLTDIPATPSVAIIENNNLVYFGPYGQGIACSQTNGFAQTVLANLKKGYSADLIISDAKGCYCHT